MTSKTWQREKGYGGGGDWRCTEEEKEACAVLEIPLDRRWDEQLVRKQYHRLALKFHPDKNRLDAAHAAARFLQVQEAYELLRRSSGGHASDSEENDDDGMSNHGDVSFFEQVIVFLNTLYNNEQFQKQVFHPVLLRILSKCEDHALPYLRRLPLPKLKVVYQVLAQYQDAFHLSNAFLESVRQLIADVGSSSQLSPVKKNEEEDAAAAEDVDRKTKTHATLASSPETIVLRPTLKDMFLHRVFGIERGQDHYYVPSWHEELFFDYVTPPFVVKCIPQLPPNCRVDEDNHLHIAVQIPLEELWHRQRNQLPLLVSLYNGQVLPCTTFSLPKKIPTPPLNTTFWFIVQGMDKDTETMTESTNSCKHNKETEGQTEADRQQKTNESVVVAIPVETLYIKPYQSLTLPHAGLPVSCQDSILSTIQKAHVFIHLWIQGPKEETTKCSADVVAECDDNDGVDNAVTPPAVDLSLEQSQAKTNVVMKDPSTCL